MKKGVFVAVVATALVLSAACGGPSELDDIDEPAASSSPMEADRSVVLERVGGAHVPVGERSPSQRDAQSASGWAQGDADLAAAWLAVVVDGAQSARVWTAATRQVASGVAPGVVQDRLEAEARQVEADRAETNPDGPDPEAWMPDMRVVAYTAAEQSGAERTITLWGRSDGSAMTWWTRTITVRWEDEDWRWVADPWPEQWQEGTPPDEAIPFLSSEGADDE